MIEKVLPVPPLIFSKIATEASLWDFENKKYENFNFYFKKHYVKDFKVNKLTRLSNIEIPIFLTETINWLQSVIGNQYVPIQAMFNVILPNQRFPIHIDSLRFHQFAKRYHICIDNSEIEYHFFIDDKIVTKYMNIGYLYFYNNLIPHGVSNTSLHHRTNLILDMIPDHIDTEHLLDPMHEVVKECRNLQEKFYKDKDLSEFIKCSID